MIFCEWRIENLIQHCAFPIHDFLTRVSKKSPAAYENPALVVSSF